MKIKMESSPNPQHPNVKDISPQAVFENRDQVRIIDVRETDEFTGPLGHIAEAELVVLNSIPQNIEKLKGDPKPVVFICKSGGRSGQAAAFASQNGIECYNMAGGMMAWNLHQLPVEDRNP